MYGLFHDLLEDTTTTYEELIEISSKEIADAVELLTKKQGYNLEEYLEHIEKDNIAKMVKLADRIHNLEEIEYTNIRFKKRYLKEVDRYFINMAKNTAFEDEMIYLRNKLEKHIKNIEI